MLNFDYDIDLHKLMYGDNDSSILGFLTKGNRYNTDLLYEWPILREHGLRQNKIKLLLC